MRDITQFKERFQHWKKTGELPYEAGRIKNADSNREEQVYEDSLSLSALPAYEGGKDGTILNYGKAYEFNRPLPTPARKPGDMYDYQRAAELGYERDATGHFSTRDYQTGRYLKNPTHPTVMMSVVSDLGEGYYPYYNKKDGQIYSDTWMKLPRYEDGKDGTILNHDYENDVFTGAMLPEINVTRRNGKYYVGLGDFNRVYGDPDKRYMGAGHSFNSHTLRLTDIFPKPKQERVPTQQELIDQYFQSGANLTYLDNANLTDQQTQNRLRRTAQYEEAQQQKKQDINRAMSPLLHLLDYTLPSHYIKEYAPEGDLKDAQYNPIFSLAQDAVVGNGLFKLIGGGRDLYNAYDTTRKLRGTYRRARNFLFPKGHYGSRIYRSSFKEEYMEPFIEEAARSKDIEQALQIADKLVDEGQPVRRYLISVPYKVGDYSRPTIRYSQQPIQLTMPNGEIVSGQTTTGQINRSLNITPRYGDRASANSRIQVLTDSEKLPSQFEVQSDRSFQFPLKNDDAFNEAVAREISAVQDATGYPVVGSSRLISRGYFGGQPGDVEVIAPAGRNAEVYNAFSFQPIRTTRNNTGVTGTSPRVFSSTEQNNLDINILDDNGVIIHQLESTRMPDKMPPLYSLDAQIKPRTGVRTSGINLQKGADIQGVKPSASLRIPKDSGDGYYTADEYFDMIAKDDELLTQSVIDNTFKSGQPKHIGRAYTMMNNGDQKVVSQVSTAIDHMVSQIPGMKRFSQMFKQDFTNPEVNREILNKINFTPIDEAQFINNPEQMKNIVDYWYMRNTVGTRSVNFDPTKGGSYDDIMQATRSFDNGSSAGGGGNYVLGNTFGGYTRSDTAYKYFHPKVSADATFDDVFNAFQRERDIWNDKSAVNQAINEVLKNPLFDKQEIKDALQSADNSWFTDTVNSLVNKGVMKNSEANEFIEMVADKLGVSGMRGSQYSTYGTYYGGMIGPKKIGAANRHVAFRNIDSSSHNQPILPAEWGSDEMFTQFDDPSFKQWLMQDEKEIVPVVDQSKKSITTKYATRKYPRDVIDLQPYYKKTAQLRRKQGLTEDEPTPTEMLRESSGFNQARNAIKERNDHYHQQLQKWQNLRQQRHEILDKANKIKGYATIAGTIGGVPLSIIGGVINSKRWGQFYNSDMFQELLNDPEFNKALDAEDGRRIRRIEREYYRKYRKSLKQSKQK